MNLQTLVRARRDLLAYLPLAVTTTIADMTGHDRTHLVSKLALAPTLAAGVLATRDERCPKRTGALLAALAGSTVGDWFMYRSSHGPAHAERREMQRGASAFAVQQLGLIGLLVHDGARPRRLPSGVAAGTLAALALVDDEGGLPDPVLTGYGLLLGAMSALAMGEGGRPGGRRLALGGGLFLLSDAAIIVGGRFARSRGAQATSSGVVLSTYTAALALLVHELRDES